MYIISFSTCNEPSLTHIKHISKSKKQSSKTNILQKHDFHKTESLLQKIVPM